jgi:hypothetical protein
MAPVLEVWSGAETGERRGTRRRKWENPILIGQRSKEKKCKNEIVMTRVSKRRRRRRRIRSGEIGSRLVLAA